MDDSFTVYINLPLSFHVMHFGVNSLSVCKLFPILFSSVGVFYAMEISMVYLTGLLVDIKALFPILTLQRMVPLLNIFKHHLRLCEYICSIRGMLVMAALN